MRQDVLEFLKAAVEGRSPGNEWHTWLEVNEKYLQEVLTRGSFLRLKIHPLREARLLLERAQIPFKARMPSNGLMPNPHPRPEDVDIVARRLSVILAVGRGAHLAALV